jgi:hypothetical protein
VLDEDLGLLFFFFGVVVDAGLPVWGFRAGVVTVEAGLPDVTSYAVMPPANKTAIAAPVTMFRVLFTMIPFSLSTLPPTMQLVVYPHIGHTLCRLKLISKKSWCR